MRKKRNRASKFVDTMDKNKWELLDFHQNKHALDNLPPPPNTHKLGLLSITCFP